MDKISCDVFTFGGKEHLVTVDTFSGYTWVNTFSRSPTSQSLIKTWSSIFRTFGYPRAIRSDEASYFDSKKVRNWTRRCEIKLELASAYHPESNGRAERNVALMKDLLRRAESAGECPQEALAIWLLTPRTAKGVCLARIMLGREPRFPGVLQVRDSKDPMLSARNSWLQKDRLKEQKNGTMTLNWSPVRLEPGLRVLLQDPKSKSFSIPGKVVAVRSSGRSSYVDIGGNKHFLRNRIFIALDLSYPPPRKRPPASRWCRGLRRF